MISKSLYLIRFAMISTFVLWTPCVAVYMFLTAVQKLKTLSKTKKRCVGKEKLSSVFVSASMCQKNALHLSDVMWSTRGLQHHLNVLMLGWYHGARHGTFLSCNGPNREQISLETSFGHRVTNWLIINVKLRRIIVQSLHLFAKHVGCAVGRSVGRCGSLRRACVSIRLDQNLSPKQINLWRCCVSRKSICKPSEQIKVMVKLLVNYQI